MRYQLLTGLLAATTLLSCKKSETTATCTEHCVTFTGRVATIPGNQPVAGAQVRLATVAGSASRELGQALTDADGRYTFTFSYQFGAVGPGLMLYASHPNYLSNEVGTDAIRLLTGGNGSGQLTEDVQLY
ncbi:MAG: carboxypeptidase regulatory-like domain-containing protein, partial [Chitinophagaceae bacterium]